MPSLFGSLGIARDALSVQQTALDVTQNNIANVNTPGYARQRINLVPGDPVAQDVYQAGAGVRVASIDAYRVRFLDYRINEELQRQGEMAASSSTLQQIEAIFNESTGTGLQASLTAFFNSFSSLANAPEDVTLREQVLARAEDLAAQFGHSYEQLQSIQRLQERAIADSVSEINSMATEIAKLNVEVVTARGSKGNENTLRDRRQQLIDRLAELTDITYFETETGSLTVMVRQGAPLVLGDHVNTWEAVQSDSGPFLEIHAGDTDITSSIQSGKLGGLLKVRDTNIASYLSALDDLAAALISRINGQHALGADLDGNPGGDFFVPFTQTVPGSNAGAARSLDLAFSDPRLIAAADATGGPGSNANARNLAHVKDEPLLSGNSATIDQFYANLIFRIGRDTKTAMDGLETETQLVTQIRNQQDAVTGVSLDEEAVDIMRYQRAYQANARIIAVIDDLTGDLLRLLGG